MSGRILLVDDDVAARISFGALLEDEGYDVLEAADLQQARKLLGQQPDVVLLDLHLGGSLGTELLPSIPAKARVVMMSGDPEDADLPEGQAAVEAWLVKGADIAESLAVIARAVRAARSASG